MPPLSSQLPIKVLFLVLLWFSASPVQSYAREELPKCHNVFYLAWITSGFAANDVNLGVTKESLREMNIRLPLYVGAVCLDENRFASFYPTTDKFFMSGKLYEAINLVNSSHELYFRFYNDKAYYDMISDQVRPGAHEGMWVAYAKRSNPHFPHFIKKKLGGYLLMVFHEQKDAIPNLDWQPEFTYTYQYPDTLYDELRGYEKNTEPFLYPILANEPPEPIR